MARLRLIERRQELGYTQEEVAEAIGVEVGSYRRYEKGAISPRGKKRLRLADVLEWGGAELTLALNDHNDEVQLNSHQVPKWLDHFASLEQGAGRLCAFEITTVHGLLQTADYAFAVERSDCVPRSEQGIARRVKSRLARQAVLDRAPDPLQLSVILDQSILHRVAGVRGVLARQLEHLVSAAGRPNIDLRILPYDSGAFAHGSFTLMSHVDEDEPYMCVTEDKGGPRYHDRQYAIEAHTALWSHLSDYSLTENESVELIRAVSKETPS